MLIKRDRLKKGMAKDVILKSAEAVFAQNGYDGTSIDAIAAKACVTKRLLYYHFKNKREILLELFKQQADDIYMHVNEFLPDKPRFSEKYIDQFVDSLLAYLKTKRDIIKIFLIEIVKENEANDDFVLLSFIQPMLNALADRFDAMTHRRCRIDDRMARDFHQIFQGIVPIFTFYAFGEKIGTYLSRSYEDVEHQFSALLKNNMKQYILSSKGLA